MGADSLDKFTSKNIKAVNILFAPGVDFENLIGRAEFNLVASRSAQAATLKAEKAGETTVDLAAAKGTTGGNGSQTSGNGSGTEDEDLPPVLGGDDEEVTVDEDLPPVIGGDDEPDITVGEEDAVIDNGD